MKTEKDFKQTTVKHDESAEKLMVVDGHSMAFRAFYALNAENFRTESGQHTNAILGFMNMLLRLIKDHRPTHLAVAFDLPGGTFRTRQYQEYKAGRLETPKEFLGQIELIMKLLQAAHIATLTKEGFEADDILATLREQGVSAQMQVFVVSGDRDTFQLINDEDHKVVVLYPRKGVTDIIRMDAARIEEKYLIKPSQYQDFTALVGEAADNLPGVPKVGPVTAAKWLREYGNLTNLLAHQNDIGGKVGESLREYADRVKRNRVLNELVRNLELSTPLWKMKLPEFATEEMEVNRIFEEIQFKSVRDNFWKMFLAPAAKQSWDIKPAEVITEKKPLEEALKRVGSHNVPVHVEVSDTLEGVDAVSVSFGMAASAKMTPSKVGAAESYYVPLDRIDRATEDCLKNWFADGRITKIIHDCKLAYKGLWSRGFSVHGISDDLYLTAYVLQPGQSSYALAALAEHYLGYAVKKDDTVLGQQSLSLDFDDQAQGPSDLKKITEELMVMDRLHAVFTPEVRRRNAFGLLEQLELPLAGVLAQMELAGIAAAEEKFQGLQSEFARDVERAQEEAFAQIKEPVNLSSPKQLQTVLFDELKLPTEGVKKLKTGYSTNVKTLTMLTEKTQHPFLVALRTHRDAIKLKQIVETLQKTVAPDSRIHTTYSQVIAATGRLSSNNPNLQNIPVRSTAGRRIREAFVTGRNREVEYENLLAADYSQIEMRILVHLSQDQKLIQAFNDGEDLHRYVGSHIFGVPPTEVTPAMRSKVKAMSYGLAYGLSSFGLSQQLGISVDEARALISDYDKRFGAVRQYLRDVVAKAHTVGYTETMDGRRRYLPDLSSDARQKKEAAERAALNAPIQGTAADIIKRAMITIESSLRRQKLASRMLLQVHDELIFEVAPGELEELKRLVVSKMSRTVRLSVPLEVTIGVGRSWGDIEH